MTQLQDDLNSLCDWSKKWLLQFNPQKCVVMHIGHRTDNRYYLVQDGQKVELKPVTEEKDLGVVVTVQVAETSIAPGCPEEQSNSNRVVTEWNKLLHMSSKLILL